MFDPKDIPQSSGNVVRLAASSPSSEFSEQFLQGMLDRMGASFAAYGPVKNAFPDKVNAIDTLKDKLKHYAETGNTEFLMDAANYCMIEFMCPKHSDAHYKPTDAKDSRGRVWNDGNLSKKDNEREV